MINAYRLAAILPILSILTLSGCALAPQTMPLNAQALGDGNVALGGEMLPTQSLRVQRGWGERLDVGVQIESVMLTGYAKYSVHQSSGFAAAIYLAGTVGPRNYSAKSIQVGPMFSYSHDRFDAGLSFRYSNVSYEPVEPGTFGTDQLGIEVLTDSLEEYFTTDLVFGIRLGRSPVQLKAGVTCTSYTLNSLEKGVQGCVPVTGVIWKL